MNWISPGRMIPRHPRNPCARGRPRGRRKVTRIAQPVGSWYFPTVVSYLTLDQKGRATLPEEVREALGLRGGDLLLLERTSRGTFELVPAALVPRDQLWFHHPAMQKRVREAEADLRAGRTTTTRTVGEAQSLLDGLKKRRRTRR